MAISPDDRRTPGIHVRQHPYGYYTSPWLFELQAQHYRLSWTEWLILFPQHTTICHNHPIFQTSAAAESIERWLWYFRDIIYFLGNVRLVLRMGSAMERARRDLDFWIVMIICWTLLYAKGLIYMRQPYIWSQVNSAPGSVSGAGNTAPNILSFVMCYLPCSFHACSMRSFFSIPASLRPVTLFEFQDDAWPYFRRYLMPVGEAPSMTPSLRGALRLKFLLPMHDTNILPIYL